MMNALMSMPILAGLSIMIGGTTASTGAQDCLPDTPACIPEKPEPALGAWIEVQDDGGNCMNYWSPNSTFQALSDLRVYEGVDILSVCFIDTVPVGPDTIPSSNDGASGWTLQFTGGGHDTWPNAPVTQVPPGRYQPPTMPTGGYTNQQYFKAIVHDARRLNPDMLITVTLTWGDADTLSRVFDGADPTTAEGLRKADSFAANVLAFLDHPEHDVNGLDIDWELPLSSGTSSAQFVALFDTIGTAFTAAEVTNDGKDYLLTLSPASPGNFDLECANVVNCRFHAVNLQFYYYDCINDAYCELGIHPNLFTYGVRFENDLPADEWDTAQNAFATNNGPSPCTLEYGYDQYMIWRLNSQNWPYEQAQTMALRALAFPEEGTNEPGGDLNGDGCIDGEDLAMLLGAWGCHTP